MTLAPTIEYTEKLGNNNKNDVGVHIQDECAGSNKDILLRHSVQGRLSTTASIRTETYKEATSVKAGELLFGLRNKYSKFEIVLDESQSNYNAAYLPFQNPTDFALA